MLALEFYVLSIVLLIPWGGGKERVSKQLSSACGWVKPSQSAFPV